MDELRKEIAAAAAGPLAADAAGAASRRYRFAPGFVGFSGHFPGDPILPAVAQLLTVVSLAEEQAGTRLRIAAVRAAKFLLPIRPNEEILVRCRVRSDGGERLHDAALDVAGRPAASVLLHLVADEENG